MVIGCRAPCDGSRWLVSCWRDFRRRSTCSPGCGLWRGVHRPASRRRLRQISWTGERGRLRDLIGWQHEVGWRCHEVARWQRLKGRPRHGASPHAGRLGRGRCWAAVAWWAERHSLVGRPLDR
jgi:hypothetical protein